MYAKPCAVPIVSSLACRPLELGHRRYKILVQLTAPAGHGDLLTEVA